jgi:hypothetical protein
VHKVGGLAHENFFESILYSLGIHRHLPKLKQWQPDGGSGK